MLDKNQFKAQGLRFARSLQMVLKTVSMFSVDHPVAEDPLQRSLDALIPLIKQSGQFTLGFVDQRVMLNKILTTDKTLLPLENEFLKRGIGAVTFEAGLTMARYKQAVATMAASIKAMEAQGGLRAFLEQHAVEGVRILPAPKSQARNEEGDVVLEQDSEAYLLSKAVSDSKPMAGLAGLELLLESASLQKPAEFGGGPQDILRLVTPTVEAALVNQGGDPQKSYVGLARILQEMRPDFVVSQLSAKRQQELKSMPAEQVAAELIEDTAVKWAAQRLASAPTGPEALVIEEDVVRVLMRSLQATEMAERLAAKLAEYVKEYTLPKATYERIQDELKWVALPAKQKQARLAAVERFDAVQFRRLLQHVKDLLALGNMKGATELADHYFDVLGSATDVQVEDLSRVPELLRMLAGASAEFVKNTAARLEKILMTETSSQFLHYQAANCLASLAKSVAIYQDFAVVQSIGVTLQSSQARDPGGHTTCCAAALKNLLPDIAIDRLIELFLQHRDDSSWSKSSTTMLRWAGAAGVEKVFKRLEDEPGASNRMALIRLINHTGPAGIEVARQRLADQRWYVVRNACNLLGELKDPDLLAHLQPLLQHEDARVQEAAVSVILKSRLSARGPVLADGLRFLSPHLLDRVLDELAFLKDPDSLAGLEKLIFEDTRNRPKAMNRVAQILGSLPGERPLELLAQVLADSTLGMPARKSALAALQRSRSEAAQRLLTDFVNYSPDDPLAGECRRALAAAGGK